MSASQALLPMAATARVLGVCAAGCHAWRDRAPSARAQADAAPLKQVRTVRASSRRVCGAPRVHAQPRADGARPGRKRIARLMREAGLAGACHRQGGPATAQRGKEARPAPDLADRNFAARTCNQLWVAGTAFVPASAGLLCLAVAPDAWSRKIVGWSMASRLRTELVLDALEAAVGQRRPRDAIHRPGQGSQHAPLAFGGRCREAGARPATGSAGDACDNAVCESFFSTLECELLARRRLALQAGAKIACFSHIEGFHNPVRPHSALGRRTPPLDASHPSLANTGTPKRS